VRLAALLSGGKDSVYAAYRMQDRHELVYLVSMKSLNPDSYMFHTVNIDITKLQAEAWGVKYIEKVTHGIKEKELEDLGEILGSLDIEGIVTGAIASTYQKDRINKLCDDLEITHFSPLWGQNGEDLLYKMIESKMEIIFSSVAALGLDKSWLGKTLNFDRIESLKNLNKKYKVDIYGEGGEYESLVLDAPWFNKRIYIVDSYIVWNGLSGRYIIKDAHLVSK
jgi:ABC transporter with metal-binding/Fe-S-binding domain ATP-binding protein